MTTVYLVSEGYGEWTPVGVYQSFEGAKQLAPDGSWETDDRGVTRNCGDSLRGGRDLFIQPLPFVTG